MAKATKNEIENGTVSLVSDARTNSVTRIVRLRGTKELMFDRYAGDNQTKLDWTQKIYLIPGTSTLCFPTLNLISFLSAHNTNSAPRRLRDARQYKKIANACLSFVDIDSLEETTPSDIPIMRDGKPITVGSFGAERDEQSGLYLARHVARLEKGIPNPKERPVLPLPWSIEFKLTIRPNTEIKEIEVMNLFIDGGVAIGLGTFRGHFGKFVVDKWENLS